MKTSQLKTILSYILVVSMMLGLFVCMTGCKKPPESTEPTGSSAATTGTQTLNTEEATPSTGATEESTSATEERIDPTEESAEPTESVPPTETVGATCVHIPGNWIVDKASTCTSEGSRHKECTLCNDTVEMETIPPIDHIPGNWITDKAATCSETGTQRQECSQCKTLIITITIDKTPHNEVTVNGKPATADATGLTEGKQCSVCKEFTVPQYVIPAIGASGFGYAVNEDNKSCTITSAGSSSDASIPSAISGYTVTGIGDGVFKGKTDITKVILPGTITSIGAEVFSGCTGLTSITFQGTTTQWNAITKADGWNANTGSYTVQCINGSVTK